MKIQDVTLDPDLESFLPPLHKKSRDALKASVEADGFTDPIIVWLNHGELVDGYNRYRIWEELGADPDRCPDIIEKKFTDKAEVMQWMFDRQVGRRNWTAAQKAAVALKMKPEIEKKAKDRQSEAGKTTRGGKGRGKGKGSQQLSTNSSKAVDSRKEIAKVAGVSEDTVRKTEEVLNKGTSEVKDMMLSGQMSANAAFKTVQSDTDVPFYEEPSKPNREIEKAAKLLAKLTGSFGTTNDFLGPLVCAFDAIKAADAGFNGRHRVLLGHHKRLFDLMTEAKTAVAALNAAWVKK